MSAAVVWRVGKIGEQGFAEGVGLELTVQSDNPKLAELVERSAAAHGLVLERIETSPKWVDTRHVLPTNERRCRSCRKPIAWARTEAGKNMPLDPVPDMRGNVIFVEGFAHVFSTATEPPAEVPRYVSHFTTCPNADEHRRRDT
jgi:hypothetical protein